MVWIYTNIINLCLGPDSERSHVTWEFQNEQLDLWKNTLPSSFDPLFYEPASHHSQSIFPIEWLLCEWHSKLRYDHSASSRYCCQSADFHSIRNPDISYG